MYLLEPLQARRSVLHTKAVLLLYPKAMGDKKVYANRIDFSQCNAVNTGFLRYCLKRHGLAVSV